MGDKHTMADLHQMQAMPLEAKIRMTKRRISEWVEYYGLDGVYVSFSGGKDSTVLLHIARELFPEMKAMFVNTGLEYPEIASFVKTFDNVDIVKPKKSFPQVCAEYGFPLISKEVSECVQGARKYLTAFIEQNHLGDRQTDSGESASILVQPIPETHRTRRIRYGADKEAIRISSRGGVRQKVS